MPDSWMIYTDEDDDEESNDPYGELDEYPEVDE